MRKIESEMLQAVQLKQDWRKDNTEVKYLESIDEPMRARLEMAKIYLHGHEIATFAYGYPVAANIETLRNYPSRTTLSRLWALGVDVRRSKGRIILNGQDFCDCGGYQ